MVCHNAKEVVTCFKIPIYDVLSTTISSYGIFPTNGLELQ